MKNSETKIVICPMTRIKESIEKLQSIDRKLQQSTEKLRTCTLTQLNLQAEEQFKEIKKEIEINNGKVQHK